MKYSIKPLSMTEVLDQAFTLLRHNFVILFALTLVLYVPLEIVRSKMVEDAIEKVGSLSQNPSPEEFSQWIQAIGRASTPAHGLFNWLSLLLVLPFTNAALIYVCASEYMDHPTTLGQAIRAAMQRFGSVLWADVIDYFILGLLVFIAAMGCALLVMTLGPLALVLTLPATAVFLYFLMRFSLNTMAVMTENVRGYKALERSGEILSGNYSQYMVLGLLLGVIKILIVAFGMVANLISIQMLRIGVESSIEGVLYALSICVFVVFYFSCRCKLENYDLTILASNVTTDTIPAPQVDPTQPH